MTGARPFATASELPGGGVARDGGPTFGIRVYRPLAAHVLRAHRRRILVTFFAFVGIPVALAAVSASQEAGREGMTEITILVGGAAVVMMAAVVGVVGLISYVRVRRGLAAGTGLEVVVSENLLKITQPNQPPHFLLRRDVRVILDLRRQVSLVHNEQQTVLTDALENWQELRERLLTWGPVERRSYAINWLWAMTPLTTLILSLATWIVDGRAESVAVALLSVAVGVALSARIGLSHILPRKQKILGILRSQLFALGALARLALYAKEALR